MSSKLFDMGNHSKYSLFCDMLQSWIPNKYLTYLIIAYSDKNKNTRTATVSAITETCRKFRFVEAARFFN